MSGRGRRPYVPIVHGVLDASRPDERDTIVQAEEIAASLERLGCRTAILGCGLGDRRIERLADSVPTVVFNLVEAIGGEGRLAAIVPTLLAARGCRFTGSGPSAFVSTIDKLFTKRVLQGAGLPTPRFWSGADAVEPRGRVIVKSVWEDASFGIDRFSVVEGRQARALMARKAETLGGQWFAEAFIEGREFNVSVLQGPSGPEVLPLAEIEFRDFAADRPRIVDFEAKWVEGSHAFHNTPRRFLEAGEDDFLAQRLRQLALKCWVLFGLEGYARIDFRVDEKGRPWVIEINANPCLSRDAGFFAAARQAGLTHEDMIRRILVAAGAAETVLRPNRAIETAA